MTRVLIVSSSSLMRAGLEALVAASSSLSVSGSLPSLDAALELMQQLQPDVVLLALNGTEENLATMLANRSPNWLPSAIVILLDEAQPTEIAEWLRLGVKGLLPMELTASELERVITTAVAGFITLHPNLVEVLLPSLPIADPTVAIDAGSLTPREIEVLQLLAEGVGNKAIARQLSISEHTVKFHVSSIFAKLNVSSRTEAVTLGVRLGLIFL